jgi:hypothetical protein
MYPGLGSPLPCSLQSNITLPGACGCLKIKQSMMLIDPSQMGLNILGLNN